MRAHRPFLITARNPLLELLEGADEFLSYLKKDVVITAEISDRHDLDFSKIFEQIKKSYMASIKKILPQLDVERGFDHYWGFEDYSGRVITLNEVLQRADLIGVKTESEELNYLIQINSGD